MNKYSNIIYWVLIYYTVDSIFYVSQIILVGAKIVIWGYCVTVKTTVIGVITVNFVMRKYAIIVYVIVNQ
jgi:hypothetical protein